MKLVTYTPVILQEKAENEVTYFPGKKIRESILLSLIAYTTRKEGRLRSKIKNYIFKGEYKNIEELLKKLEEEILAFWPWLQKIKIPDIKVEGLEKRRVIVFDIRTEELIEDTQMIVFKGEIEIGDIKLLEDEYTKLSNALRSFAEALASFEWKVVKDTIPSLSDFYMELKGEWVKKHQFPLRVGYWSDDPYLGWLFSFWRVKEIREYLVKHLKKDPYPERIIYSPKERATFGWAYLKREA